MFFERNYEVTNSNLQQGGDELRIQAEAPASKREKLFLPQVLVVVSSALKHYVPPDSKRHGEYHSKAPLIADFDAITQQVRAAILDLPKDMQPELRGFISDVFDFAYQHPLPNAVDAAYKAVDLGMINPDEVCIETQISLQLTEPASYSVRISDNGAGFSKVGFDRLSGKMFISEKPLHGRNLGGVGESYCRLIRDCGDNYQISIETLGEERVPRALTIVPDKMWNYAFTASKSQRTSRGTDVTITRPLPSDIAQGFREYFANHS